ISFDGDVDAGTLDLDAGELLTASLTGAEIGAEYTLALLDSNGMEVATSTATPGQTAAFDNLFIPASGRYTLQITGDTIHSSYSLVLLRNAGQERVDSNELNAYNLGETATDIAPRWAVLGQSRTATPGGLVWGVQPATGQIVLLDS